MCTRRRVGVGGPACISVLLYFAYCTIRLLTASLFGLGFLGPYYFFILITFFFSSGFGLGLISIFSVLPFFLLFLFMGNKISLLVLVSFGVIQHPPTCEHATVFEHSLMLNCLHNIWISFAICFFSFFGTPFRVVVTSECLGVGYMIRRWEDKERRVYGEKGEWGIGWFLSSNSCFIYSRVHARCSCLCLLSLSLLLSAHLHRWSIWGFLVVSVEKSGFDVCVSGLARNATHTHIVSLLSFFTLLFE